jgi:hypothetical protein
VLEERKQEIITVLQGIFTEFEPSLEEPKLTMFGLVSRYNATGQNTDLIGGDWVIDNCPEPLCTLQ